MPSSVRILKVASRMWKIYGISGNAAGWIEPSYLKRVPWRLSLLGKPSEDFRYLSDAKEEAKVQGLRY